MTVQAAPSSMERELEFRKKLTGIANQINSAESILHILMTLKNKILELLDAERLTTPEPPPSPRNASASRAS